MKIEIDIEIFVVVTHYKPGRAAPACSNPSDVMYSDPGDDIEFEFDLFLINNKKERTDLPEQLNYLYEYLYDDILDQYENECGVIF